MATGQQVDLNQVIDQHLDALSKPGVLAVRPGYKVTKDWLTPHRAIVVTVTEKRDVPIEDRLPTTLGGVPVDVRQASTRKRQELQRPADYAAELRLAPDTGSVPHFADERTMTGHRPAAPASAHAQLAKIHKQKLDYTAPDGVTLAPIEAPATLLLSASPDTGWPTLRDFLTGTTASLTVGLYDFTSAHVLDTVQSALAGNQLKLVLDHPPKNPTADQTNPDTVADLRDALGDQLGQAWALSKLDPDATAWIFLTSYHIKVAVRDSSAFWLSSGNWNNSNQPDLDPAGNPADAQTARHRDRDWHVVIDQPELARVFEAYLLHDLSVATDYNLPPEQAGPPLTPPRLPASETPAFAEFFPSRTVQGTIRLTPLLTPDLGVYAGAIKTLISSATQTLYLQFQYIELPKVTDATSQAFVDLVQAVIDRQNAGVEVKIIMSEYEVAGYLEQLQAAGLNVVDNVKIQNNVHNKGIIVDGHTVLVSSQNWSTDGTLYNRDAGIIIENADAAQYFQQIFLHDWRHLAKRQALPD